MEANPCKELVLPMMSEEDIIYTNFYKNIKNNQKDLKIFLRQISKYYKKPISKPITLDLSYISQTYISFERQGRKILVLLPHKFLTIINSQRSRFTEEILWNEIKIFSRNKSIEELI